MEFNLKQRLAIMKSIIELIDLVESYEMVERRYRRRSRFDKDAPSFMTTMGASY